MSLRVDESMPPKAILMGVDATSTAHGGRTAESGWGITESLDELAELAKTAGVEVLGRITQRRPAADVKSYLGDGKLEEARMLATELGADVVICDDELHPSQIRNIERATDLAVLDRTQVILDIFAARAQTSEGQLQVELAQLTYLLPRLRGAASNMSRLGGGIGTRGPGESKLETDQRRIRERIADLKHRLVDVEGHRELLRRGRDKVNTPFGALVGYTNAGKSSLLNLVTKSDVLAENMLFATLDPVTRRAELPSGRQVLLSDTVGFIRKLPHHLVAAFRATLDEVAFADFLVHVVDVSNSHCDGQIAAVEAVLNQLDAGDKPTMLVLNKADLVTDEQLQQALPHKPMPTVVVSLKAKTGLDELLAGMDEIAYGSLSEIEYLLPYPEVGAAQALRGHAQVVGEEYDDAGLRIRAVIDSKHEPLYARYRV